VNVTSSTSSERRLQYNDDVRRREFLSWGLGLVLAAPSEAWPAPVHSRRPYTLDVGVLYDLFTFHNAGGVEEVVDDAAGHYDVVVAGQGSGMETRVQSTGRWRDGRWAPVHTRSRFVVRNRESRTDIAYDYERGLIAFRARAETFVLGRERRVDDTVAMPAGGRVDDALSALLNYRDDRWPPDDQGVYRTLVVRRARVKGEKPDDVQAAGYRAELVPLTFTLDGGTALFDLTRFSSWASEESPGRITFGGDRRPQDIAASLMLGTRFRIRFG
jgi:hypothetical protein